MVIEKADVSDAEEILLLQKTAYISEAEIYNDYNIPPLIQSLQQIIEEFSNHLFLKVQLEGKIVGSVRASVVDGVCTLFKLIVHPDYQNRGIGTGLIKKIEEIYSNCSRFEIFTGHKSERNIYLYRKLGYKVYNSKKITDELNMVYLTKNMY